MSLLFETTQATEHFKNRKIDVNLLDLNNEKNNFIFMNFGTGLKRIVNIPFWIWIILGLLILFNNNAATVKEWLIFGLIIPIVIRYIFFYIIDGFFKK